MAEDKKRKKTVKTPEEKREHKFSKEQLLASGRFRERRDLIDALLDGKKQYTIRNVEEIIENYLKGKVR
jgi:hypothetical protein